jgi:hypothetical protein
MASRTDLVPFIGRTQGWAGGVNARDSIATIGPDEARRLENMVLDEKGGANKRLGTQSNGTFGVGADRAISLYTFYRANQVPQVLMHTTGGKLYYTNDPTANPVVWTQIATGLSGTQPFSFETFNSKCYFTNGVDSYASWDGATYTTFGSAPKGRYIRLWKDTMFVGGVDATPDRVFESAAGDAETWPVASWVDIAHGDGDRLTALGTDGFTLVVFKQRRHMAITDPVTLANRVVDFEKGCESHFSVIQHEGELYFLSRRGVCQYYGDSPSRIISFKLDPVFDPTIINLGALSTAWAYTVENRVGWAIPEVGQNFPTLQIEYYPRLGPISQLGTRGLGPWAFMRMPAQVFTRWRYLANEFLYGGAMASNKFYYLLAPVGTDDGATFSALLETGPYDFGNPTHDKFIRRIILLGRGRFFMQLRKNDLSSVAVTYTVDMVANSDTWGDENWNAGTWGPDSIIKQLKVDTDLYGRQVSFIFTDSETTVGLSLIEVGSKEYQLTAGKWGIYSAEIEGSVVGLRS